MRKTLFWTAAIMLATTGVVTGVTAAAATSATAATSRPCGTRTPHTYRHVVWVWMENHSYGQIIGNKSQAPYLNSLASSCGVATNYHNISHPSLPNYLSATSGLTRGQLPKLSFLDCGVSAVCHTSASSIFAQGETWKAYQESMPSSCAKSNAGLYAVRHNPPAYYTSLPGCGSRDVSYSQLATDLAHNTLPAFSFITPNLADDMHNGTVAQGDKWLSRNLPAILNSSEYRSGSTVVFITWDEGAGGIPIENCATNTTDASCHVATLVISPSTPAGARSGTLFNHYSLLGTTEQLLGLHRLGQASSSPTMTSAFKL